MYRSALVALACSLSLGAQEIVSLKSGGKIMIYPNNTWVNVSDRPVTSKAKESINCGGYSIYYDASKWTSKGYNDEGMLSFEDNSNRAYAIIAVEQSVTSPDDIASELIHGFSESNLDVKHIFNENRIINGIKVFAVQLDMITDNKPLSTMSYVLSGSNCQIIITTLAPVDHYKKLLPLMTDFLNGVSLN